MHCVALALENQLQLFCLATVDTGILYCPQLSIFSPQWLLWTFPCIILIGGNIGRSRLRNGKVHYTNLQTTLRQSGKPISKCFALFTFDVPETFSKIVSIFYLYLSCPDKLSLRSMKTTNQINDWDRPFILPQLELPSSLI